MSKNRLDMIDTLDQLGHDHWKALATKLGGLENVKCILRGTFAVRVHVACNLTALTSFTVAGNTIDPHDFFKTQEGLWTSSNFNNFILSGVSKKTVSTDEATIGYADVTQDANDAEISSELPDGHVFEDVDTFLAHLATLIEGQWGGKEGTLFNNGYANIFYVKVNGEVFAVGVRWVADRREWSCVARHLDDLRWNTGDRVFSAMIP